MQEIKTFKSGLRLVVENVPNSESVSFDLLVKVGSENEDDATRGISHFVEHMLFKSTKNYSNNSLMKAFNKIGGYIDAYTSIDRTVYSIKCIPDHLKKGVELLSEMFFNHKFDETELETERNVILEEIQMNKDSSGRISSENLISAFFAHTPIEHPVIGYEKTVKCITKNQLHYYVSKHYKPENVILSFAGDITMADAMTLAEQYFQSHFKEIGLPSHEQKLKKKIVPKSSFIKCVKSTNAQSQIRIAIPTYNVYDENIDAMKILNVAFGNGMGSKLFTRIREELGLVYSISSSLNTYKDGGYLSINFSTSHKNVETAVLEIKKLIEEVKHNGINEEEFENAKTAIITAHKFANEKNGFVSNNNANTLAIFDRTYTKHERIDRINKVQLAHVNELAKDLFSSKNIIISYVGKETDKDLIVLFNEGHAPEEQTEIVV
ncbi:MAG: hypothetical protein CVV59_01720 [Tenericutes bacterium HGW-Tenericutes-4]|nr:MAG: hypothetical protein CVV59_01720 [Tenericutes bacterium HGW-Tenericutes-4]